MRFCRSPVVWNEEKEVILCREILVVEPFRFKKSTKDRGESWTAIAKNLNKVDVAPPFTVDQRAVREHFAALQKRYAKKALDALKESGVSPEVTELDVLMEEIMNKVDEYEKRFLEIDEESKKEKDKEESAAHNIRQKCMETYAETRKRKQLEEGGDAKAKKSRYTGSETIGYLREKAERDHALREQELQVKQNEQQNNEKLLEQQQTLLATFQQQQSDQQQLTRAMMQMQQQTTLAILSMIEKMNK